MKEKKLNLQELKSKQIEILDFVHDFCIKNNINYWIDCGTLLGAIRHKGYIPWDDDIDIGMLRNDYDKLLNMFNSASDRFKFYSIENKDDFYTPYGKILDLMTVLYEPDEKNGIKTNINIDVFIYDNVPNDNKIISAMFRKRDFYNILNKIQLFSYSATSTVTKNFIRKILHILLKIFPKGYFCKKIIVNSKKYSNIETSCVGNFAAVTKMVCSKDVFASFIDVDFEGKKYKAPIGYDKWLKAFYGDYMKLPPKEKQVSHHSFVAYSCHK